MNQDLINLIEVAENATPGKWRLADENSALVILPVGVLPDSCIAESVAGVPENRNIISANGTLKKAQCIANAKFIAAACPEAVLSLIDQIEQWQAIAGKLAEYLECHAADARHYSAKEWVLQAIKELGIKNVSYIDFYNLDKEQAITDREEIEHDVIMKRRR